MIISVLLPIDIRNMFKCYESCQVLRRDSESTPTLVRVSSTTFGRGENNSTTRPLMPRFVESGFVNKIRLTLEVTFKAWMRWKKMSGAKVTAAMATCLIITTERWREWGDRQSELWEMDYHGSHEIRRSHGILPGRQQSPQTLLLSRDRWNSRLVRFHTH